MMNLKVRPSDGKGWEVYDASESPSEENYYGVVAYGFSSKAEALAWAECPPDYTSLKRVIH